MRKAEARARRCLEKADVKLEPIAVVLDAGAAPRVRGFASDSAVTRCIREALERFDLRVAEGQRMHTFFAHP